MYNLINVIKNYIVILKQFWHYGFYEEDDVLTFEDVLSEDSQEPGLIHLDIIATSQGNLRDAETIFVHSPMLNSLKFNTPRAPCLGDMQLR